MTQYSNLVFHNHNRQQWQTVKVRENARTIQVNPNINCFDYRLSSLTYTDQLLVRIEHMSPH